jgi:hypothetical protein
LRRPRHRTCSPTAGNALGSMRSPSTKSDSCTSHLTNVRRASCRRTAAVYEASPAFYQTRISNGRVAHGTRTNSYQRRSAYRRVHRCFTREEDARASQRSAASASASGTAIGMTGGASSAFKKSRLHDTGRLASNLKASPTGRFFLPNASHSGPPARSAHSWPANGYCISTHRALS